jgi:hypothetical protein
MIVNSTPTGWEVIYQPAHALLAAQIAAHWRTDQRPERWVETLVALAQHDDEAREWTGRHHLTEAGAPLDFSLSHSSSLRQPALVTHELEYKSQWSALLISMHMVFLYGQKATQSTEWAAFLDEQRLKQKHWRAALKVTKKEAERAYALFQWCDRLSLILCRRELPEAERALEVSAGPDGTRYDLVYHQDVVTMRPWPFEEPSFQLSVESKQLTQLSFHDDGELQAALQSTPVTHLTWKFGK